ncbi:hypothetical protein H5410_064391 [Solanum commersonii]|uniref:Uncharacterized protein n=1 Tax=Solanum commersonii TaxID=4109 RepID=A0A9J5VZM3_SOLCO|nr:hypothetical protein H5410_064391 [Solanum commersonii]
MHDRAPYTAMTSPTKLTTSNPYTFTLSDLVWKHSCPDLQNQWDSSKEVLQRKCIRRLQQMTDGFLQALFPHTLSKPVFSTLDSKLEYGVSGFRVHRYSSAFFRTSWKLFKFWMPSFTVQIEVVRRTHNNHTA